MKLVYFVFFVIEYLIYLMCQIGNLMLEYGCFLVIIFGIVGIVFVDVYRGVVVKVVQESIYVEVKRYWIFLVKLKIKSWYKKDCKKNV